MNGARSSNSNHHPNYYGAVDDYRSTDGSGREDGHEQGRLCDSENQTMQISYIQGKRNSHNGGVSDDDDDDNIKHSHPIAVDVRRVVIHSLFVLTLFVLLVAGMVFFGQHNKNAQQQVQMPGQALDNHLLIEEYIRLKQQGNASRSDDTTQQQHRPDALRDWSSSFFSSSTADTDDSPDIARFYKDQLVDHFSIHDHRTWSNRYYQSTKFFGGPGHPILMIVGGEGSLDHGILYPFVKDILAAKFRAAVLQIEHRFYGPYRPIPPPYQNKTEQLLKLLTPEQAMADMINLTNHVRYGEWGCSPDRHSSKYCPVVTIGASYPGFLSAMFRIVHPDFAEISYASSAPLLMYAQISPPESYYDVVTKAADVASPGCASAVRDSLDAMMRTLLNESSSSSTSVTDAAHKIGICTNPDGLPSKDVTTKERLAEQVLDGIVVEFSNIDMGVYPPGPDTDMYKTCQIFQNKSLSHREKLRGFFQLLVQQEKSEALGCDFAGVDCDEVQLQLPPPESFCYNIDDDDDGDDTDGDDGSNDDKANTNVDYMDGWMWDFQTCTKVIFLAATSNTSMFPPVPASFESLERTCQLEGLGPPIHPRPYFMLHEWDYMNKLNTTAEYILFTNGMQDMWSAGSVLWNVSDTVLALNFEHGAHHSDLSHEGPNEHDTSDILEGYSQILTILGGWLDEVQISRQN